VLLWGARFLVLGPSGYSNSHQPTRGCGSVVSSPAGSAPEPLPKTGFGAFGFEKKSGDDEFDIFYHSLGGYSPSATPVVKTWWRSTERPRRFGTEKRKKERKK